MLMPSVNGVELEEMIENNDIVFVDFWASWCGPCMQFSKIYETVAQKNPDLTFAKINLEKEADLAETFQIRSIPYLMIFKSGIVVYSEAGSLSESAMNELVEQALKVDVSHVRDKVEAEKNKEA